jgi:1-acyl-sn-glycerol-3-phosphate acyltransferase
MNPADLNTPLRLFLEGLAGCPLSLLGRMSWTGLENVPSAGPLILVGNHTSVLDGNILAWPVRGIRRPRFLGKAELFRNPFTNWLFRSTGCIPVDRTGDVTAAMREALDVLQRGGSLVMFPEGRRLKAGETRLEPKSGVGFLAAASGAWVLPARLRGAARFPLEPLSVSFGKALPPPPPGKEHARAFARAVMDAVYAL